MCSGQKGINSTLPEYSRDIRKKLLMLVLPMGAASGLVNHHTILKGPGYLPKGA